MTTSADFTLSVGTPPWEDDRATVTIEVDVVVAKGVDLDAVAAHLAEYAAGAPSVTLLSESPHGENPRGAVRRMARRSARLHRLRQEAARRDAR